MCQWFVFENFSGHAGVKENERANIIVHRRAKQPTPVACSPRKIWKFEEFETLPASTKPRTSHHRSPVGDRRGNRKR